MSLNFEYIGGHIWSALEPGEDGYDKTVISIEMEQGKVPWAVSVDRRITKEEMNQILELVYNEYKV
jgi:hypothetical protein